MAGRDLSATKMTNDYHNLYQKARSRLHSGIGLNLRFLQLYYEATDHSALFYELQEARLSQACIHHP